MKRYDCWKRERVEQVMDTEALQVPQEVFLATHHPVLMTRQDLQDGTASRAYSEQELLKDFLSPSSFAFVPVLGDAGTGKSHLIRWLHTQIPETEKRRPLLIPKVGTNLRSVIERIVGDLEGERFDTFRKRLHEETDSLTEGRARELLLNNIATEIGPNGAHGMVGLTEGQEYCVQTLPALLYDPVFRKHFLSDGGIIDRLATHVLGRSDRVERLTERRKFTEADLSFRLDEVNQAGAAAREVYFQLSDPSVLQEAVRWLNFNLDASISSLLHLRGEGLLKLMTEVREVLAEKGVELILLIEDFAKLQGIEHQLLEALLVRSAQEGHRPLCGIRTALACTSGYFRDFRETVKHRTSFTVNLDIDSHATTEMEQSGEIQQFVARYLNASRVPANELKGWFEGVHQGSEQAAKPPNACEECPFQEKCHHAFGQRDGVGLYPFNALALQRMQERVSPGRFVPRLLIKDVLKHTLETYTDDLKAGHFPSPALRAHFGTGKAGLPIAVTDKIHRRDPNHGDRREVLLEFWSSSRELVDLDPVIHEAFDLPPLGVEREEPVAIAPTPAPLIPTGPKATPGVPPVAPESRQDPKDAKLDEQLEQLNAWLKGGTLASALTQTLREHLHAAITGHHLWDPSLLLIKHFVSETGGFQVKSINFHRQSLQFHSTAISLRIPEHETAEEFRATALALEGLLRFHRHGHWGFPGGARYLRAFTSRLDRWTSLVLARIQAPTESETAFDPVPAAVELLTLGARLAGRPAYTKAGSIEEVVDVLFSEWAPASEARGASWKALTKVLSSNRQKLQQIVVSRTGCTKGGRRAVQIVDGVRIVEPLERLLKDWRPHEVLPQDLKGIELEPITKVRQKVDELLDKALAEEQERHLDWESRVTQVIEPSTDWKELLAGLRTTMTKARDAGAFVGINLNDLEEAIKRVETLTPSAGTTLAAIARLREQKNSDKRIVDLSRDHHAGMSSIETFIERAQRFLNASSNRVNSDLTQLRTEGGQELEVAREAITTALATMEKLAEELKRSEG
ncbi:protein DpdH [Hyalangium gracile]|uniref:protein DpdH n=1 Tax=Hyalangium gracile TaxID=394092 RepID=UPI001CCFD111|nr:protein DpdH [Hyalangium gracile]